MIPVGDDRLHGAKPAIVNYLLLTANVLVFLYQVTMSPSAAQDFVNRWGTTPVQILQGNQWITLLTSMFLHGGWLHLIGNMLFLWVFGDNIEATVGSFFYLIFYLAGGVAATATHIFLNPQSAVPSVGASGAISAVLGAYIVMFPRARVHALVLFGFWAYMTRVSAILFLGIWFLTQLLSGVASLGVQTAQTGGVAFWAHIGGFVFGFVMGFLMRGAAAVRRADYR